jgi:hypothetical protein
MDIQSNLESPVITPGDSIRINGIEITFTGTTVSSAARDINSYGLPGITASTENGQLRLNSDSKVAFNVLAILPGVGDVIQKLGLQIYPYTQAIEHPYAEESEYFGTTLKVTDTAGTLFVTSQGADTRSVFWKRIGYQSRICCNRGQI